MTTGLFPAALALAAIVFHPGPIGAGQSQEQKPAPGEWTGQLRTGIAAVGGETTGIVLITERVQYELEPADKAMRDQMAKLDKQQVVVKGTLRTVPGVEVKERRIIKVTSIVAKPKLAASTGTFPTDGPLFIGLLIGVILIMGGLQFFPAQALGPIVEHFQVLQTVAGH